MTVGKNPKIFRIHYGGDLKAGLQLLSGRSGAPHSYYPETVLLVSSETSDKSYVAHHSGVLSVS